MENASKALLIAGAILIAIILISIGMLILNSTTEVTDQVGDVTASQSVQVFNSKFQVYAGEQKGSAVKQLLSEIAVANETSNRTHNKYIYVYAPSLDLNWGHTGGLTYDPDTIMQAMSKVNNSAVYLVEISAMDSWGYITTIKITQR